MKLRLDKCKHKKCKKEKKSFLNMPSSMIKLMRRMSKLLFYPYFSCFYKVAKYIKKQIVIISESTMII